LEEVLEVMGDREACATEVTPDQVGVVLEKSLEGGFLAAGFKWSNTHYDYSFNVLVVNDDEVSDESNWTGMTR
jgi:hypothetical protein